MSKYVLESAESIRRDPEPAHLCVYDEVNETFDIDWGAVEPYWIGIERIDTPTKLLGWLAHLLEKTWFSNRHARDLINCWQQVTKQDLRRGV